MSEVLDHIQMRIEQTLEVIEAFRKIQKRQAILLNIMQRKLEIKDYEIIDEEKRLDAKLERHSGNS